TRSKRDWSSDVCSSDLVREAEIGLGIGLVPREARPEPVDRLAVVLLLEISLAEVAGGDLRRGVGGVVERGKELRLALRALARERSEERRVGKECRVGRA